MNSVVIEFFCSEGSRKCEVHTLPARLLGLWLNNHSIIVIGNSNSINTNYNLANRKTTKETDESKSN